MNKSAFYPAYELRKDWSSVMNYPKKPSGIIFNIQKFSIHDGPGIRTTVFFKGCPLRCLWCANPESQLPALQILWDKRKCLHCRHCEIACPTKAISFPAQIIKLDPNKCTNCQKCVRECPQEALTIEGEEKSVAEILKICLQDRDFYEESNGGVTLSGGEVLSSPDFALALLFALKGAGIHTAIETSGYAKEAVFLQILKEVDLILFDMKHWQLEKHIAGTGVSNALPLANMKTAIASGKKVLPRIPVIPGYNDQVDDAIGFAERLREVQAKRVQLLPFHQFGQNKYILLNRAYTYDNVPALQKEDLLDFQQEFLKRGIQAFF